ncbi:hypothetical protein GWI33_001332 [Rhynchophorus ferrugineus]|uniref:Fatty acid desaturase domain-containing protein n=1 Tax=Rhynchophorus ferrugineus TaxID=354439 RepID=A0A834HN42_RHYFE|nr:hypothetical protein GWI33_001332 [Rhynchophorus ferrugineus]
MAPLENHRETMISTIQLNNTSPKFDTKIEKKYENQIVWKNVILLSILHGLVVYGFYLLFAGYGKWKVVLFNAVYWPFISIGITAGAHRLWAHRTYKANLPLRIYLMLAHTAAAQNHIYDWVRDHRVHHKYTDTDADPHNATRGFFFSHMGWLLYKKHKDVIEKGKTIDMSDILADPVLRFQIKYYYPLVFVMYFIPVVIPWYFFDSPLWHSFLTSTGRYVFTLHGTWCINSVAHKFGTKPYDKSIRAVDNSVMGPLGLGEGWHNYHHVFPWDYKTGELSGCKSNFTAAFIEFMAKFDWATDLKKASDEMIRKRVYRTGDGTWSKMDILKKCDFSNSEFIDNGESYWGWGDKDMKQEEIQAINKYNHIRDL